MSDYTILIVPAVVIGVITYRFTVLAFIDKASICAEVEKNGHTIIDISWNPFGRGWFGEKGERHYVVNYKNSNETFFSAECKTSLFTGVY